MLSPGFRGSQMNYIEALVARASDLEDGQMKQVSVGKTEVLLSRIGGEFYAVGAFCSHYGAPLAKGAMSGKRVVCPWHNACFSLVSGDQLEPPGLDALAHYEVRLEGKNVMVRVPDETSGLRTPDMASHNPDADGRVFVVLGAGAAGSAAVEMLRQAGFQGRVVMLTQEAQLPYDRTRLSKDYFIGKVSQEKMPLRTPEFYREHQIEVLCNRKVVRVDVGAKTIGFEDGTSLAYDSLLLASGGKPRRLPVEGVELKNVFTLRSFEDTDRILAAAQGASRAVVIGSSFIGMEAASGLTQLGVQVTVVSPDRLPFEAVLGEQIGQLFRQVHEEQGVVFRLEQQVIRIEGSEGVEAVVLDNGERLDADLVVIGIGVQPATEFLEGITLNPDASVPVDEYLRAGDGLYAAGDIACYPDARTGTQTRIEHWRIAAQHGRVAACNMAGQTVKFAGVPVFWTAQFKFPLRYIGHAQQWDEIILDGNLEERKFLAYYVKDGRVLAIAASQRDTQMAALHELMRLGHLPEAEQLRKGPPDPLKLLEAVAG